MSNPGSKLGPLCDVLDIDERQFRSLVRQGILPRARASVYPTAQTITAYVKYLKNLIPDDLLSPKGKHYIADSFKEAALKINCSPNDVQRARAAGAPGFLPHGRINVTILSKWIFEKGPTALKPGNSKDALEIKRLQEQCRRLCFDNDVNESKYAKTSEVDEGVTRMVASFAQALRNLPQTLAPDIVGCATVPETEKRTKAAIETVLLSLHKDKWKTE